MSKNSEPWDTPMNACYSYTQPADSCCEGDQLLTVKIEDAGGGPFLVISTERWAIDADDIDRFADMLRRAVKGQTGMRDFFNE